MSHDDRFVKNRLAGKWQMPLFVLAIVLLSASVYRSRFRPTDLPAGEAIAYLDALLSEGLYRRATELGEKILQRPGISGSQAAEVHLALARAGHELAVSSIVEGGLPEAGRRIAFHYEQAEVGGARFSADDFQQFGRALEWQGRAGDAVGKYRQAVQHARDSADDLRKHILTLTISHLHPTAEQLAVLLDEFLAEISEHRLDLHLWGLERRLQVHEAIGTLHEAEALLAKYGDQFAGSAFEDRFAYWTAWWLHATGAYDLAERTLRELRNGLESTDEVYAMAGYLLGRVVLFDGGPQRPLEAISFFTDVLRHHPDGPYAVASRIGLAEALTMLERHEEALEAFRAAIDDIAAVDDPWLVSGEALRSLLGVTAQRQRSKGRLREAVAYAHLGTRLINEAEVEQSTLVLEHYGQLQAEYAAFLGEEGNGHPAEGNGEASAYFLGAASAYLQVARLNSFNERLAAEARWRAADLFARGGAHDRAIGLFGAIVRDRPHDPLVPRALLRMGQLYQAAGDWVRAVETYQECFQRFPRTLEASEALIPLARSYLAMGGDNAELAEKTLRIVLEESEVFTPDAPEFSDALFLLGEVQRERGRFEEAIGTLSEAVERFPDDPRALRAYFLMADAYRHSGRTIMKDIMGAEAGDEVERLRGLAYQRFETAAGLYRRLIEEYELRDYPDLNETERLFLRLAHFYEADCYFDGQDYLRALSLYELAAARYRDVPGSLALYSQMIRTYVALGRPDEARAALARALVLVDAMPAEAFARSISTETRADWKRFFTWLSESGLF